jgi:hypothetical protein
VSVAEAAPGKKTATRPGKVTKTPPRKEVVAAETAVKEGRYDEALQLYERAAAAVPADKSLAAAAQSLKRRFVPTLTESWSRKGVDGKLTGFETGGVAVKRVPENEGRLDFVISPPRVRPGDTFKVDIHLTNAGKKPIRLSGLTAVRSADGKREGGAVALLGKKTVEMRQREHIGTVEGTWAEVAKWLMDVQVAADNGDAYNAKLKWE